MKKWYIKIENEVRTINSISYSDENEALIEYSKILNSKEDFIQIKTDYNIFSIGRKLLKKSIISIYKCDSIV